MAVLLSDQVYATMDDTFKIAGYHFTEIINLHMTHTRAKEAHVLYQNHILHFNKSIIALWNKETKFEGKGSMSTTVEVDTIDLSCHKDYWPILPQKPLIKAHEYCASSLHVN